jgi:hypothetical protein
LVLQVSDILAQYEESCRSDALRASIEHRLTEHS